MSDTLHFGIHLHQVNRIGDQRAFDFLVVLNNETELLHHFLNLSPAATVILRYGIWNRPWNPDEEGRNAGRYMAALEATWRSRYPQATFYSVGVNEPILEWFNSEPDDWNAAYEVVRQYQEAFIETCAVAGGHPLVCLDQGWYNADWVHDNSMPPQFEKLREATALSRGVVYHGYTDRDQATGWDKCLRMFRPPLTWGAHDKGGIYHMLASEIGGKPIFWTEFNTGTDAGWNASDAARTTVEFVIAKTLEFDTRRLVHGIAWFIYDSPDPQFQDMRLPDNAAYPIWTNRTRPGGIPPPIPGGTGMNWGDVWNKYSATKAAFPALLKKAAELDLGERMGPEEVVDIDGVKWVTAPYPDALVATKVGEYQSSQIRVIRTAAELPK